MRPLLLVLLLAIANVDGLKDVEQDFGKDVSFTGINSNVGQGGLLTPSDSATAETNTSAASSITASVPYYASPFNFNASAHWVGPHSFNSSGNISTTTLLSDTTPLAILSVNQENDTSSAVADGSRIVDVQGQQAAIGPTPLDPSVWDDWIVDVWNNDSTNSTSTGDNSSGPQDPPATFIGAKDPFDPAYRSLEATSPMNQYLFDGIELQEKTQSEQGNEERARPWWPLRTSAAIAAAFGSVTRNDEDEEERRRARKLTNSKSLQCRLINSNTGNICNTTFSRTYDFQRHIDTIHSGTKLSIRCHLCAKETVFGRLMNINWHLRGFHSINLSLVDSSQLYTISFSSDVSLRSNTTVSENNSSSGQIPGADKKLPFYCNPKQFHRILKRRVARQRLEHELSMNKRGGRPYLHESRHHHLIRRPRGPGGRFLTAAELEKEILRSGEKYEGSHAKAANPPAPLLHESEGCKTSNCASCGGMEDLWVCSACGNVGCGDRKGGHAKQHWRESGHNLAYMLVRRTFVWNYQENSRNPPSDNPSLADSGSNHSTSTNQLTLSPYDLVPSRKRLSPEADGEWEPLINAAKRIKIAHLPTVEQCTPDPNGLDEDAMQVDVSLDACSGQDAIDSDTMMIDDNIDETLDHETTSQLSPTTSLEPQQQPNGNFTCPHCPKSSHRSSEIRKHMTAHTKPVHCLVPTCDYACATNKDLRRHHKSKHAREDEKEVFFCPYEDCGKRFSRPDNMLRHKKNKHGETPK